MSDADIARNNRDYERERAQKNVSELVAELYELNRQQTAWLVADDHTEHRDVTLLGLRTRIAELQRHIGHSLYWALTYGAANFHFTLPEEAVYPAYRETRE